MRCDTVLAHVASDVAAQRDHVIGQSRQAGVAPGTEPPRGTCAERPRRSVERQLVREDRVRMEYHRHAERRTHAQRGDERLVVVRVQDLDPLPRDDPRKSRREPGVAQQPARGRTQRRLGHRHGPRGRERVGSVGTPPGTRDRGKQVRLDSRCGECGRHGVDEHLRPAWRRKAASSHDPDARHHPAQRSPRRGLRALGPTRGLGAPHSR